MRLSPPEFVFIEHFIMQAITGKMSMKTIFTMAVMDELVKSLY